MQNFSTTRGRSLAERFQEKVKVNPDTGCHEWQAFRAPNGYGKISASGRPRYAHRVAYEMSHGPIPAGLQIDHLCRVRHCVNPAHLEAVEQRENIRRGRVGQRNAAKTHCPSGHAYSGKNLYVRPDGGRGCHTCRRAGVARKSAQTTESVK